MFSIDSYCFSFLCFGRVSSWHFYLIWLLPPKIKFYERLFHIRNIVRVLQRSQNFGYCFSNQDFIFILWSVNKQFQLCHFSLTFFFDKNNVKEEVQLCQTNQTKLIDRVIVKFIISLERILFLCRSHHCR